MYILVFSPLGGGENSEKTSQLTYTISINWEDDTILYIRFSYVNVSLGGGHSHNYEKAVYVGRHIPLFHVFLF